MHQRLGANFKSGLCRKSDVQLLGERNENALVLIAHNDGRKIMFPDGNSISFAEVANIKRAVAPKRAIVLVTCSAGGASGEYLSLAETMLANNLATTVFASPSAVDAQCRWQSKLRHHS